MKKIYTWAAQPSNRTLTVDDLKKAKGNKCPVCWKISEKPCERHG